MLYLRPASSPPCPPRPPKFLTGAIRISTARRRCAAGHLPCSLASPKELGTSVLKSHVRIAVQTLNSADVIPRKMARRTGLDRKTVRSFRCANSLGTAVATRSDLTVVTSNCSRDTRATLHRELVVVSPLHDQQLPTGTALNSTARAGN